MLAINKVEIQQLQALASGSGALAQRAEIILASGVGTQSATKVALALGTSPVTVRYWRQRFMKSGVEGLYDRPRSGAPRRIDPKTEDAIRILQANGLGTRQIAERLGVSQSTVSRILRLRKQLQSNPIVTDQERIQDPQLVARLFESLAEASAWTRFLDALQSETNSDYCNLLVFSSDSRKPVAILSGTGPLEGAASYLERFYDEEPMAGIPEGKVTSLSDIMNAEELKVTQFYKQYLSRYDVSYVLGVDIGTVRGITGKLRLARRESLKDYSNRERSLCDRLIPFLRAALDLFVMRIDNETEIEALSATISGMSVGSILVDADARIMDANNTARAILAQSDGLVDSNGKLHLDKAAKSKELLDLIRRNAEASLDPSASAVMRSLLVDRPSGRESVSLLVRPATIASDTQLHIRPTALINLVDPSHLRLNLIDSLVQLFCLTQKEARVAMSISNGLSIDETAKAQMVRPNTVRSHLRSIYSKLGVTRQAELVRTVLISVALLTAGESR